MITYCTFTVTRVADSSTGLVLHGTLIENTDPRKSISQVPGAAMRKYLTLKQREALDTIPKEGDVFEIERCIEGVTVEEVFRIVNDVLVPVSGE